MAQVKKDKYVLGESQNKQIISSGQEIRLDLELTPLEATIGGTVYGEVKNLANIPIEGALISIMDANYEPLINAVTDMFGKYVFNNIPVSSQYTIFAISSGTKIVQGSNFSLVPAQSVIRDFTLESDPALSLGIIAGDLYITGSTNPIQGAVASLYKVVSGVETLVSITGTNPYGQFAFREVEVGTYKITLRALNFNETYLNTSVTVNGEIVPVIGYMTMVANPAQGTISGVITNELNQPINRADAILYRAETDGSLTPLSFTKTNTSGVYLFQNVPVGTYKVKSNELEIVNIMVP